MGNLISRNSVEVRLRLKHGGHISAVRLIHTLCHKYPDIEFVKKKDSTIFLTSGHTVFDDMDNPIEDIPALIAHCKLLSGRDDDIRRLHKKYRQIKINNMVNLWVECSFENDTRWISKKWVNDYWRTEVAFNDNIVVLRTKAPITNIHDILNDIWDTQTGEEMISLQTLKLLEDRYKVKIEHHEYKLGLENGVFYIWNNMKLSSVLHELYQIYGTGVTEPDCWYRDITFKEFIKAGLDIDFYIARLLQEKWEIKLTKNLYETGRVYVRNDMRMATIVDTLNINRFVKLGKPMLSLQTELMKKAEYAEFRQRLGEEIAWENW